MRTIIVDRLIMPALISASSGLTAILLPAPPRDVGGRLTIRVPRPPLGAGAFTPILAAGPVSILPPALDGAAIAYPPRVIAAAAAITPPVLLSSISLFAPTVQPGAAAVQPPFAPGAAAIFPPIVSAAPAGSVMPPLLASTVTTPPPAVQPGSVAVAPVLLGSIAAFYAPTVQSIAANTIIPSMLLSTSAAYAPAVAAGMVTVMPSALATGAQTYAPALQPGAATLAPTALVSTASFYAPAVLPGVATVTVPPQPAGATLPLPTISTGGVSLTPALLASTALTRAPSVAIVPVKALADGDSITKYSQAAGDGWDSYARLWKAAHPSVDYTIAAVGGAIIGTPGDAAGTNSLYGRLAANLALNPTHVSIFIGANDMDGYASAQAFVDALFGLTDNYKATGAKVGVGTVLPRTGRTGWNARRAQVNALIRAAVGTRIDDVFDFDTSYMGQDGAENSTANYVDGLHPTAAGQAALLRVYQVMWNYLLGIPNEPLDFTYAPATGATADTDVASASYTVSGLHAGESRPYQAAAGTYVSKNGGVYVLAGSGSVVGGDTLSVRKRSSATAAGQVNAVLTIGTTQATFTITTAGAGSRDWLPSDLGAKLAMWQKPETLGADTSAVNGWADQSGNGNNLTIDTAGSGTPTVTANAINGLKAVRFDPAQNAGLKPPTSLLTGRTSLATFIVSRNTRDPNTTNFGAPLGSFGTETGDYWVYANGGIYTGYGTNTRRDNMDAPGTTTDWHQFMLLSAPNDWRISQDGVDFATFTANTVAVGTAPKIGRSPGIGDYFDGYLAEIVDLNAAPTSSERQLIEGYLAWKYGLQGNLPAGHPYKSAKPTTSG